MFDHDTFELVLRPGEVALSSLAEEFFDYETHLRSLDVSDIEVEDFLEPENFEALSIASDEFYWYLFPGVVRLAINMPSQMFGYLVTSMTNGRIQSLDAEQTLAVMDCLIGLEEKIHLSEFDKERYDALIGKVRASISAAS